jgi:antitoxin component YwqK of YwqJK toxin-antitoxin module
VVYEGYFNEGKRQGYGKVYNSEREIIEQGWYQNGEYKGYK